MYIIKNISGYLSIAGLYPGKTKKISKITPEIKDLINKNLISVSEEISKTKSKRNEDKITKEEVKD